MIARLKAWRRRRELAQRIGYQVARVRWYGRMIREIEQDKRLNAMSERRAAKYQ